jgi:Na+/melibiose symporter-like transporter
MQTETEKLSISKKLGYSLGIALSNSLARKYGKRDVFSIWLSVAGIVVGLNVGMEIGGALAGYLLSQSGYVPNVAEGPAAIRGIRLSVSIYPAIAIIFCVILLFIYGINRKVEDKMQYELAERRKNYA